MVLEIRLALKIQEINFIKTKNLKHLVFTIRVIVPVIPAGGIMTRPSSPYWANILRISLDFV